MKAVVFADGGALHETTLPDPEPGPRDLLLRIEAVSVNPVDVKIRTGAVSFGPDTPPVLGFDASATVLRCGPEVTRFAPGDTVFHYGEFGRPGANAQLQLVDERLAGRKPATLDHAEAAVLPLTAITAWEMLFERLRIPFGVPGSADAILVINGAGGVGSILIQLARRFTGLTIVATASRPETVEWARRMGAHHVINHHEPLDDGLRRVGVPQVRYVAGLGSSDRHRAAIPGVMLPFGELSLIDDPETFDIVPFKVKNLGVHWELMATRPMIDPQGREKQGRILDEVSALVDAGLLRTTLQRRMGPLTAASLGEAHALIERGEAYGKLVLDPIAA